MGRDPREPPTDGGSPDCFQDRLHGRDIDEFRDDVATAVEEDGVDAVREDAILAALRGGA